ncbi:MAG TPA: SusC/RagA family TonB-linked outer membrane protein, partial [Gemmatimonadaceae bacterium]
MRRYGFTSLLALLFASSPALAQNGSITGTVTSADGAQPVAGVQVTVAGTQLGALTNENGRYTISVQPGTYTVRATRIGFAPDSLAGIAVTAGTATTANFQLKPLAVMLTGTVVIGYGTREARDVTGSVAKVTSADFNTGRVVSPEQLIQAKVPGVQVISNNQPGGGIAVRIRGGTSVKSSNDPLFVVDGVPLAVGGGVSDGANALSFLNPDDIESITVLKDASATAIYGSRGANGVVLITTKSGGQGSQVTYDVSASQSTVARDPNLLNAEQLRAAVQAQEPSRMGIIGDASTDWMNAIERTATGQQHNLAFSGGRDEMRYRLSLGYLDQGGVVKGSNAERVSAALNYSDIMFDHKLEVRANLKGSRSHDTFTPDGVVGAALAMLPTQPIRTSSGSFFEWSNPLGPNNPVSDLTLLTDRGTEYRSVGNIEAKYHAPFLDGLSATVRGGYDVARAERTSFSPSTAQGQLEASLGGTFARNNPSQLNTVLEVFGDYSKDLDRLQSNVDVTAGYTYEDFHYDSTRVFAQGLSTDLLGSNGIPGATTEQNFLDVQDNLLISFFGRVNYTLRDKYLLTASLRRDGSSKFGPSHQWGVFPSAAVAWRIGNEPFMQNVGWLSDLKLRLSWGRNGNQAFPNYLAYSSYAFGSSLAMAQFGNQFVTTIRPSAVDPNIKWEQTTSTDAG